MTRRKGVVVEKVAEVIFHDMTMSKKWRPKSIDAETLCAWSHAKALQSAGLLGPALSERDRADLRLGRLVRGMPEGGALIRYAVDMGEKHSWKYIYRDDFDTRKWGKTPEEALRSARSKAERKV